MKSDKLIRLMVGVVFFLQGFQKFCDLVVAVASTASGHSSRFAVSSPRLLMWGLAAIEVICGALILMNRKTRLATLPLFGVVLATLYYVELPTFLTYGFWATVREARADFCLVCGLTYLFLSKSKH